MNEHIAFIGGGNMASAIIGGLLRNGIASHQIVVVEPYPEARARISAQFSVQSHAAAGSFLSDAALVIWAVKPQSFKEATQQVRQHTENSVHLSVAAGIRSDSIANWLGNERIIRAMPNTPALIGKGITALYARPAINEQQKKLAEQIIATTGEFLWLATEQQLDAVTAISGSGPAYMFYFMEAMIDAGIAMGLSREQAHQLTVATFIGAGELARNSEEPPETLRQRVTSKGGTTYAAISAMDGDSVQSSFIRALHAAQQRAKELGDEFGAA